MNAKSHTFSAHVSEGKARRLPGVDGVWVFAFLDMAVFAVMFGCFMVDRSQNPALFEHSRQALNLTFGGVNTLVLLTSSMLVVLAIDALKHAKPQRAPLFLGLALTCGLTFIVIKIFEYKDKLDAGHSMLSNDFFMYYFVMTGIHLAHVAVGSGVLTVLWFKSRRESNPGADLVTYESGATYWHMVDLLWICLFPLLYLVR